MKSKGIIIYLLFLTSCANVVAPKGGEKDVDPPILVNVIPENESTTFSANTIVITFDEFIRLNNPANQIIISPPIEPTPDFRTKGRSLYISFDQKLRKNTTYSINFGESIVDLNEGNILKDFKYVFSTGEYIDSLTLAGNVVNARTGEPAYNAVIMLYESTTDSALYKYKPYYFTKSSATGSFKLTNLKEGTYQIYALDDLNNNYLYDSPNEKVAFLDSAITISDTVRDIKLYLFQEEMYPKITSAKAIGNAVVKLSFNGQINESNLSASKPIVKYKKPASDSIMVWFSDTYKDTIEIYLQKNEKKYDSIKIKLEPTKSADIIAFTSIVDSTQPYYKPIKINFTSPIETIEKDRINLFKDTLNIPIDSIIQDDSIALSIQIYTKWKHDSLYYLKIADSALLDIYGNINSSKNYYFKTSDPAIYGSLTAKIDLTNKNGNYIFVLSEVKRKETEIILKKTLNAGMSYSLRLDGLDPGNYQVLLIQDLNANTEWDTGNISEQKQPEPVILYPQNIAIKPNWESEIEIDI